MQPTINAIVEAQRRFFETGATREVSARRAALERLGKCVRGREEQILAAVRADLGKPRLEAYLSEVHFVLQEIGYAVKHLTSWARPRRVSTNLFNVPARCEIRAEPYGVVLILGPWNYPFQLVMGPVVSAIAAGNCVTVKPSEHAAATAAVVKAILAECFDTSHVAVFDGGPEVAQELLAQAFDYVFYTGNAQVGRLVMEACVKNLTPLTLELGGKCPCIVDHRIDLRKAVQRIARGKFFNAGQTCVAPDYVCVHESIYEPFLAQMSQTVEEFYGKEPRNSPDYGRIINQRHFDRLTGLLPDADRAAARNDRESRFFGPIVLRDAGWQDRAMEEEIFGPILPCLVYSDVGSVLAEVRRRPKPLALYIFSNDTLFQERCLEAVGSGGACINDTLMHITPLTLPFGGVGQSGMGQYHGKFGFDTFTHARSVMRKGFRFDLFGVCPPYGAILDRIKRFL